MTTIAKRIITAFIIGIAIFVIGSILSNGFQYDSLNEFLINFAFYQLYSFVLGFSNMIFFDYMNNLKWKEHKIINIRRTILGILGSVTITMIGLFLIRLATAMVFNKVAFKDFIENESYKNYSFGLWITLTIVVIFHFIFFYNRYHKKKVKDSQIVAKVESAKFESLKSQLDPHFLFNSLNVLTSLIGENPNQAEKFTTKLSKVYRYVLEQKNKDLIPLEDELKFAQSYMELLKMRFEDAIHFTIPETVSDPDLKIVPLSLQLLLENAVKHNVITSDDPLEIKIYEDDGFLIVENNMNPKASLEKGTKVGLKNIQQRYGLITERAVSIEHDSIKFKVKLPLLTQKIKIMNQEFTSKSDKYRRAQKQVEEIKGFYASLIAYCVIIPFLVFLNYRTSWDHKWFFYPMFGWGIGLVIQGFMAFGYGTNWEERKIREYMNKDNKF